MKVPVLDIPEPGRVAIQEGELSPATVEVSVDVVLLGDSRQLPVIK